jgi:hypothetical protein
MSDDEGITHTQAEAWIRDAAAEERRQLREEWAAEAATSAPTPATTVTASDREIRLSLLRRPSPDARPMTELEAHRVLDDLDVVAEQAEAVAAERVRLQASADADAERARANSLEGRAAAANVALRVAQWKTQKATEFAALLTHEGQLPPGGLELMSEDEIIQLGQKPRTRSPIEVSMDAAQPPRAGGVAEDPNDFAVNVRAAGWTKDES